MNCYCNAMYDGDRLDTVTHRIVCSLCDVSRDTEFHV